VEAALLAHPSVAEAAAVEARPRPDLSIIAAFVVAEGVDGGGRWRRGWPRLAAYKRPKRIDIRRRAAQDANRQAAPPRAGGAAFRVTLGICRARD
jgi:hypothetical protein